METEVPYLNGWIVKRGEEVGIRPVMNYMLMHLVVGKQQMISREVDAYVPWDARAEAARNGEGGDDAVAVGEAEEEELDGVEVPFEEPAPREPREPQEDDADVDFLDDLASTRSKFDRE